MRPDHPSDPPPRSVSVDGGLVTYTDEGAGPILLALHGSPGNHRDFRWISPCLQDHFRVIRVDMPGMGATPYKTFPKDDLDGRADFVHQFLRALQIERCTIMGHSMGGGVAAVVAELFPEIVERLVLVASPGLRPHEAFRKHSAKRWHHVANAPIIRWLTAPLMRPAFQRAGFPSTLTNEEMRNTLRFAAKLDFDRLSKALRNLETPTLVAWTEDDQFIEPEISRELSEQTPNGPRMEFPDGGHNIQKTRAIEISDAIKAWSIEPDQLVRR